MLINGDSLNELKKIETNSVDLIVTDPPYGYSFMGKDWDKALPDKGIWKECLRVLKHGGFAYVMSAPRQDVLSRMIVDLENSGFNTSFTSMYWAYASGFPKGLNISKAIDKKFGNEREVIGKINPHHDGGKRKVVGATKVSYHGGFKQNKSDNGYVDVTVGGCEEAKKLEGSYAGFQPKPAVEVIIVCMKPLEEKGYVDQALKNGKGVSWFDDCRIPYEDETDKDKMKRVGKYPDIRSGNYGNNQGNRDDLGIITSLPEKGRYPANLLVSDNAIDIGVITKSTKRSDNQPNIKGGNLITPNGEITESEKNRGVNDSGDFSRYFDIDKWYESQFIITPKASKSEKNKGLDDFEDKKGKGQWAIEDNGNSTAGMGNHNPLCLKCNCYRTAKMKGKKSCICDDPEWRKPKNLSTKNNHPTVKPLKLMSYLITLGSREGDVVLDPFMGSGTTPLASKQLNRKYIGIEREEEYFKICEARVENC